MIRRIYRWLFVLWIPLALALLPLQAQTVIKPLGEGVVLKQYVQPFYGSPQIVNVLEIDLRNPSVRIEAEVGTGRVYRPDPTQGREAVSAAVQRLGALAGVNADFFPFTGDPLNLHIQGGELVSEPSPRRSVFGVTAEGVLLFGTVEMRAKMMMGEQEPVPLHGVNRPIQQNECVLITPRWGEAYPLPEGGGTIVLTLRELNGVPALGNTLQAKVGEMLINQRSCPVPTDGALLVATGACAERLKQWQSGSTFTIRFDVEPIGEQVALSPEPPQEDNRLASRAFRRQHGIQFWKQARTAVGGGPWLLRNGEVFIDAAPQGFNDGFTNNRHPRTVVGATADGKLLLVTVDGRQPMSGGMTLLELAQLMKQLGASDAINLDGGGSTTLAIRGGLVVNSPSEGKERPVANAVMVYAPRPAVTESTDAQIEPVSAVVRSGESVQFVVRSPEKGQALNSSAILFGTTGGIGFVDQNGLFTAFKAGKGAVNALLPDDRVLRAEVTVLPGDPARIVLVQPTAVPSDNARFEIVARVVDRAGNPCAGVSVQLQGQAAYPQRDSAVTDQNGIVRFFASWEVSVPAVHSLITLTVSDAKGATPLQIKRPVK
ncbi:MAG: phosphodiester glycosidase family protein [Armatimonadota bacterium]|nr:phosphodiester glycosidase family protein [Armatimonadota bacterium]